MKLVVHPAADIFPMMSEQEMKDLKRSITAHGLREKIGVIPNPENVNELVILDGRNRWHALVSLGVKTDVIIREFTQKVDMVALGATPSEYVAMANIDRRNLTQKQRRELAGKLAVMYEKEQEQLPKEEKEDSLQKAAEKAGVSRRTVATAKKQHLQQIATPSTATKPAAKKPAAEKMMPSKQVTDGLENYITAIKKFGPKWATESLEIIAEFSKQLAKLAADQLQENANRAQQRADAAKPSDDEGSEH